MTRPWALAGIALAAGLTAVPALPHALAPFLLELEEEAPGRVRARLTAPRLAAAADGLVVQLPESCRPEAPAALRADALRVVSEQRLDCGAAGLAGAEIGAVGLAETRTDLLLRVARFQGPSHEALLSAGRPAFRVPERASAARVLADYGLLGAEHLAGGLDHLLFVAGLFLLGAGARRLIATLTAFTLGHSATLSLVALGAASPPAALVEIGIAASLVAQAFALASGAARSQVLLARRPWLLAAGFGLLHGLGFAGALREIGLPEHALPLALLAFNAGIEAAQLAFVAFLAAATWLLAARPAAAGWPAHALGGFGAFLLLDRLATWLAP